MITVTNQFDALLEYLHDDIPRRPAYWAQELFGRKLWSRQIELVEAPFRHMKSAIGTGHGVGKTDSVSIIIPLWLLSHYPSYVIVHGASWTNISKRIWPAMINKVENCSIPELRARFKSNLPRSNNNAANWKLGNEWEAIGLSPTRPEVSQGWHSEGGSLVAVDEASELEWDIFNSLCSFIKVPGKDAIMMEGNPLNADGPFADVLVGKVPGWKRINISSEESPNYVATMKAVEDGRLSIDDIPPKGTKEIIVIPGLETASFCRNKEAEEGGRNSPEFQSRVLGIVPDQSARTFIPRGMVRDCGLRDIPKEPAPGCVLTCDPATSGIGDLTVILVIDEVNKAVIHAEEHQTWDADDTYDRIKELVADYRVKEARVDVAGYGKNVEEKLTKWSKRTNGPKVIGINNSWGSNEPDRYGRLRDEAWDATKKGLADLAIDPEFLIKFDELSQMQGDIEKGRLKIEEKKAYKKRHRGRSPNYADALVLYFTPMLGDRVFERAGDCLRSKFEPIVTKLVPDGWGVGFEELKLLSVDPRPGQLHRAMWYSRTGAAACVWAHVDDDGTWTVFRSHYSTKESIREFCTSVFKKSYDDGTPHTYMIDVMSAPVSMSKPGRTHIMDSIDDELTRHHEKAATPWFMAPSQIGGMDGLDDIDRMILATLARFPEDRYWVDNEDKNPDDFMQEEMLICWPGDVVEELKDARLKMSGAWDRHPDADKSEEAIGGGGSLVRCLRLLVVAGAGV